MGRNFEEYLEESTKKIMEIVSSPDVGEEEKNCIIDEFSNELLNNIGNTDGLKEYEPLLYGVSVRYIDKKISIILSSKDLSYRDCESTIKLCQRQQELIDTFQNGNWELPEIENVNLHKCIEILCKRQESVSISNKIIEKDCRIDELRKIAHADLSVQTCDEVLQLLAEIGEDIAFCKSKKISLPVISNKDTKKVKKEITDLRKIAEQKEALHYSLYDVDNRIYSLVSLNKATPEQWQEIVDLCQKQLELLSDCNKNRWSLPTVRYVNPNEVADKYKQYLHMIEIDKFLSSERDSLSSNNQYESFLESCDKQKSNIEMCTRNGWEVPFLKIVDLAALSDLVHEEKNKKDKIKKYKSRLILAGSIAVCIAILALGSIHKYREGKIQIPFDPAYVVGEDLDEVYDKLVETGFEKITKKQDDSGWQDGGKVVCVNIDNSNIYDRGDYQKPDVNVEIIYSSTERIYITNLLENWNETEYETMRNILKDAGFTNVIVEEVITSEKGKDKLTAGLSLNGEKYTNEHCYLPSSAPIIISYYTLKIGIGNNSSQFIGQDYETVVSDLMESGFTNVQTQKITAGWAKGNTVVGVTVNNVDNYDGNEVFEPNVKIVVKYSSDDRIDVTSSLKDWQTKNYEQLQKLLRSNGFNNITVVEKITEDKSKNQLVSGIALDNNIFTAGECYLQKSVAIRIEYYVLMVALGDKASSFEGKQYSNVVSNLKAKGFTNIQLQRTNNLINGWITKEGSIKAFSINGDSDFDETDTFHFDDRIVIIVNTFKGKGCEDITAVAE